MRLKFLLILLVLLTISIILSGCHSTYQEERYFSENFRHGMTLEISNDIGNVEIRNWESNRISVVANITGYASSIEEARRFVDSTQIRRTWHGSRLHINSVTQGETITSGSKVDYVITIPRDFNADINTTTGDIRIEEIRGNVNLKTSTGDIRIRSLIGDIFSRTSTGNIRINEFEGEMDIETSTGNINVSLFNQRYTQNNIRTSTGDIELVFFSDPSAFFDLKVSTGDIYYFGTYYDDDIQAGRRSSSTKYNIRTSTGDIFLSHR
ncbi:DUF4097 family beta strand repeat-containing protein [Natronospora cellulosivora (SeqCode)]